MNEEYLKELYGYIGGEEAVGGDFDQWRSHMISTPQAQKDMFDYLGGEKAVGGSYDEWLQHTGIGKQTEFPIEGVSDIVKKKEVGEEVSESLAEPTTSEEKFEQWEIDLFKHFDDNPSSLETASNIDIRKYNEYKNTPTDFSEEEISELEAIDKNPRSLAWGSKELRDKYIKYKKQQVKPTEGKNPLKEATSETEEQKSLFDMASSNVNDWYDSMGGLTPLGKMDVFKTKVKPLYEAYEQEVLYAENQDDLDKINSDFKNKTSEIAKELALDVTEDGSVKPFDDEIEQYKDRLETELKIGSKRLSEEDRDSYLNDITDRLAAGTHSFASNMVDLAGFLTGANYFEGYKNLSEGQRFRAEQFREQSQRYDGTIQELAEQGNIGQAGGLAVMSAVESLPAMIPVFANPSYGLYVMGAGAGMEEYRNIEDKDIPEWKKVAMSVSAGMNEAVWEKVVTVPILAKSKQAMFSLGKRQGKKVVENAVDASLKNSVYKAKGQMPEWVAEGLSEVATGVSNDIAEKIYVDPETQIGGHAFDDFAVGSVMGKVFSAPSSAVNKLQRLEQKQIVKNAMESIPDDVDFETTLDLLEVISERDALVQMENKLADEFKGKYRAKIIALTDKANEISNKYYAEKTGKEVGDVEPVGASQQKIDYLIEKGVKIPDGTTGEQLDEIYNAEKEEKEKTRKEATPPTEEEAAKEAEKPKEEKPSQKDDKIATEKIAEAPQEKIETQPRVDKLKEEKRDDEKEMQEQQVQEQDEKRQTEKPTKEEQVSEAGTETRQEDVVQEEVKVKSFKKGDGGTKGTFKDDSGTVYKSLVPTEARIVDGKAERVPMEGKTTDEYDILSELQDRDYVPKIGKKVSTSEGEAFEIEELQEAESISIDEYKELRRQLQELEDDGYFIGDNVSVMRRNGKLVITDFSNAYKGSRGGNNMDYVSSVHDLLRPIDKAIVESTLSAMNVREVSDLVGEDVEPNTYLLTQRPPSIGTHPTDGLIGEPKETKMGNRTVWELQYDKPLSDADIKRYELNPVLSMKEYGGMMVDGVSGNIPFYIRNIDGRTVTLAAVNPKGKTIENAMRTSELVAGVNSGKYKLINPSLEAHHPTAEAQTQQKGTIAPTEEKVAEKRPKAAERAKRVEEINAELGEEWNNLMQAIGGVKNITGEQRKKVIDSIPNIVKLTAEKYALKGADLVDAVRDFLKANNIELDDELNTKVEKDAAKYESSKVQEKSAEKREERKERDKDLPKDDRPELQDGEEVEEKVEDVLKETQRVLKSRKGSKVVSHFAARMTLDETNISQELKERIVNKRMGMHDILTDEEADAIAQNIIENNSLSVIRELSMKEKIHPSIRVSLFVGAHKILAKEEQAATKEGRTADAEMWGDEAYEYYQQFNDDASRKAGQLLRRLGTDLVLNEFAPYAWVGMYKKSVERERYGDPNGKIEGLINTSTHKKSRQRFTKAAKESRQRAIDKTIEEIDSIVKTKNLKEKAQKLKKKEEELIAKWKKAKKESAGMAAVPFLTQANIEYGVPILIVKLERFGYNTALATKSFIETVKSLGMDITEDDVKKIMPKEIDGMTIDEKERQNEIEKHAMRVASGIMSEVVDKKQKDDPVQRMINTLLGKFKERDTAKKKKEPKSDLERIAEAIRNVDEYADVWAEANAVAIEEINNNDKLSPQQKQEAIDRVNRAYKEATSFSFTETQVDRAIKRKMKDLDMRVKDVVKEFLPLQSVNRERIAQAMLEDAGLDGKQAEKLTKAVFNRFDKILAKEKTSLIDKYIGKIKDGKTNISKYKSEQRKSGVAELLELVNIGAFDSDAFREAYATSVGIRNFDAEAAEDVKETAKKIQSEKEDVRKHKMSQDLLKKMTFYGGLRFSDAANAIWYTNVLGNIKTQERNVFGGLAGVTARLMSEAVGTGRILPILRAVYKRGFKYGWQRFKDVWKEGYAPFSDRLEIPNTSEVFNMTRPDGSEGLFQLFWNRMKYVGRFMNGADLLNATIGKESFAEILAHEALNVNRAKYAFNPTYRKEINRQVDEYLSVSKEEVQRFREEIEEDAKQFGYSQEDKDLILLDRIDKARPIEVTEEATRFGLYATGNVPTYGTLGSVSEALKKALSSGIGVWKNRKTGEVTVARPLKLFAAFTKIAGNIGSMSLNFVPGAALHRIFIGKYGSGFLLRSGDKRDSKYIVDLTDREKRSIIHMQVMGTLGTFLLFGLSDGGDDDDPLVQITANLTGDYKKNRSIENAEEYSLGVKLPNGKRLWISYKYTPLITMLAPIGHYRDAYKYRNEDRPSMDVLIESYIKIPFFLSDMTAIASMTDVIEKSISNTGQIDQLAKSLQRTVSSFYTPSLYRDVTNMVEFLYGGTAPIPKKSGVLLDPNNLKERFMGRNPLAVAERIIDGEPAMYSVDALGRTMPVKQVWNELVSISDGNDEYNSTYDHHISQMGGLREPDPSTLFFNVRDKDGGMTKIRLYLHDKDQAEIWFNYCKKRADIIFRAMQVYEHLDGDRYKKELDAEIRRAGEEAKAQVERELMQRPPAKIKKWQKKR